MHPPPDSPGPTGPDPDRPPTPSRATASWPRSTQRRRGARLLGLDAARGLAVLGMFVAHFNPYQTFPDSTLQAIVSGRSAGLFAVLAGITTALLSGADDPPAGAAMRERRVRLAVRAVLLFGLGLALTALGTSVKEILTAFAALFLLALPILRVRPVLLAAAAALLAVLGPVVSFLLRAGIVGDEGVGETIAPWHLTSPAGIAHAALVLTVTGVYPLLTWAPFLLAGMAIGRLPLREAAVRRALVLGGATVTAACYGLSWLLTGPLGGYALMAADLGTDVAEARRLATTAIGAVPTVHPVALLTTAGHSGAPLEIGGVIGLSMVLLGVLLVLGDRVPGPLTPLIAVGSLALTCYVGHIVVIAILGPELLARLFIEHLYLVLVAMVVGALVLATVWRSRLGQGPLERPISYLCRRIAAPAAPRHLHPSEHRRPT
ncbi:heparan-alpha-glucosaminide N-acetyltransferase domain-containing protein [Pseudonocardia sp. ICBG1293]|uniref:heparan-alpha-glucosaminide N-acetyltransferase domain-containing protein n=1 Tax=Pseudonocardia sp. ICBG1293 TaxID=2844382 RepID=UPI001CC924D2|nr:heparan-alpha-glucosaminide N-acetyltransferase domain-containing protein [Pseudonocardia sp. ICBG1293]